MLTRAVQKAAQVWRREGLAGVSRRIFWRRRRTVRDTFDDAYGVSTHGDIALWKLKIADKDWADGAGYRAISVDVFERAMKYLPIDATAYTFIDLGSGKGRALILAAKYAFNRVIGVEFSEELCAVAVRNLRLSGTKAEVLFQNAKGFVFPQEPSVILLYNPFGADTLACILPKIRRGSYLVYVNPRHAHLITFKLIAKEDGLSIWSA